MNEESMLKVVLEFVLIISFYFYFLEFLILSAVH